MFVSYIWSVGSKAVCAALGIRPGPVTEQSTCLLATTSPWISFSFGVFLLPLCLLALSIAFRKCRHSGLPGQFRQSNVPLAPATPLPKPCQCPFSQQQWEVNGFPGGSPDLWMVELRFLLSLESSASSLAAYFSVILRVTQDKSDSFFVYHPFGNLIHSPAASEKLFFPGQICQLLQSGSIKHGSELPHILLLICLDNVNNNKLT